MSALFAGETVHEGHVLDEWIDVNDHMNVAYYVLAFDAGIDKLWHRFGITSDYIRDRRMSTFAVEAHIEYLRELQRGAPLVVTSQVLAFDDKRIHQFMRMFHRDEGFLAATSEWMNLHVDLEARRVVPWSGDVLESIRNFAEQQEARAMPERAGRRIQIRKPQYSVYETAERTT
jgi:acyl-CoA thioester hydrolase